MSGLLVHEGIFGASPSEPVLDAIENINRQFAKGTDALDTGDVELVHYAALQAFPLKVPTHTSLTFATIHIFVIRRQCSLNPGIPLETMGSWDWCRKESAICSK